MKNARPWLVIFISVLIGAAAVYFAAVWVSQQASIATQKVVVAARDLEVGTRLQPDMLQVVDWPSGTPLKEPFDSADKVRDRVVNQQVLRGEPILAGRLAPQGEKGGLSAVLETGKRAITVKVNEIVGVAGFALPGNFVDVMVNTPDDSGKSVSKIVLERIKVLAVAQDVSTSDTKARVVNAVTLEVTPQQAEQIDLARSVGSLSLVLRSQADNIASATSGARKTDLFKAQPVAAPLAAVVQASETTKVAGAKPVKRVAVRPAAPAAKREPVAAPKAIEVIRGLKRTEEVPAQATAPAAE